MYPSCLNGYGTGGTNSFKLASNRTISQVEELMGLFDRIGRAIRATLNSWISKAEDPEKVMEQAIIDMQDDLIRLRQAVAQAIATQKRSERQQAQAASNAAEWYQRAQLALQKGEEELAREALTRRKTYLDTATTLKEQLGQQVTIVAQMKKNMVTLEGKLAEAKTKKDMFVARARSAKASEQLNEMLGQNTTGSSIAAFERMEEKVLELEARSEAIAELNADTVEGQFAALEGTDVDAELAAMKSELMSGSTTGNLPANAPDTVEEDDPELAKLRMQLEEGS
jgi:phage shock protein A